MSFLALYLFYKKERSIFFKVYRKYFVLLDVFFTQRHAFHLVDPSIMPLLSSLSCLVTTLGAVLYFHGFVAGLNVQLFGLFSILICMFF